MATTEEEKDLVVCVYSSAGTEDLSESDLMEILDVARSNNKKLNVSGMLLFEDGSFFQVLEGQRAVIDKLYESILADKRHQNMSKILYQDAEKRLFSDWTMGYADIPKRELNKIEGLNDFFVGKTCYTDLDEGRAKTLLEAFAEGRWRNTIK